MLAANSRNAPRVLILSAEPDPVLDAIAQSVPEAKLISCKRYNDLSETLEREQPDVALIFKIAPQPFPREVLLASQSLQWIHNAGAGMDHLLPWNNARLTVTNSSGIHGELMSQYTIWAILNHRLGLREYARRQAARIWLAEHALSAAGTTLVIVGFGTIGAEIGRVGRSIGLRVIGVRTHPVPSDYADLVVGIDRLHDALGKADYVSVVLPITSATRNLIDERAIAATKPGAYIINTGRGGIVNETALLEALRSGHVSGALLDVFENEPLSTDSALWDAPNTTILPHISGDPVDWRFRVTDMFVKNLRNWMADCPLANVVDPARGY